MNISWGKGRNLSHFSASALCVIFSYILLQFPLEYLEGILIDARFRLRYGNRKNPEIALIAYDQRSCLRYHKNPLLPIPELINVLKTLEKENPKAVGILHSFKITDYTDREIKELIETTRRTPNVLIGYIDDEVIGKFLPLGNQIRYLPGFVSRDTLSYGVDSVSRRVMISVHGTPTLYAELARIYRGGSYSIQGEHFYDSVIPFNQSPQQHELSQQTYTNWQGGPHTYPLFSTLDVIENKHVGQFKNKIVLIGRHFETYSDHIFTPYSRSNMTTPFLEGAAHGLSSLMNNDSLKKTSKNFNFIFSIILGLISVNFILAFSPGKGIIFLLSFLNGLFLFSFLALISLNLWIELSHPMLITALSYYMVIPYRLIEEYHRRWHFQEKSEMMHQLEQLKDNFLSLVSHDLKTPVARIQGSAELLLNKAQRTKQTNRDELVSILHSAEDLSQYIETILDLTRIEGGRIPIQKTFKDINTTILESIEHRTFLAKEKGITVQTALEPIFAFKFDHLLISKVLTNILENAIKYSPPNTSIRISSKETSGYISIAIQDEGVGIPLEEQEKVFTKFYRCKNPQTEEVKGTGLGLYLVRYFIELHDGSVDMSSKPGKGTTIRFNLPA